MSTYFITGISTDVGKTVVSAIIAEALKAHYWKPIQAGDLDNSDSIKIKNLTEHVIVLEEAYRLNQPMSPHAAAKLDKVQIPSSIRIPEVAGNLIIEGAGGLLVPFNAQGTVLADLAKTWNVPTIVVSRHYLGSINHTLLTIEVLKNRGINIKGIVFVGDENKETESIIEQISEVKILGRIPMAKEITKEFILEQSNLFKDLSHISHYKMLIR